MLKKVAQGSTKLSSLVSVDERMFVAVDFARKLHELGGGGDSGSVDFGAIGEQFGEIVRNAPTGQLVDPSVEVPVRKNAGEGTSAQGEPKERRKPTRLDKNAQLEKPSTVNNARNVGHTDETVVVGLTV